MRPQFFLSILFIFLLIACAKTRIHEHDEFGKIFKEHGINTGCFIVRDHTHDALYFFNKEQCLRRFLPASTFKIFNSLVSLETAVAADDQLVIKWDSVVRRTEWDKDMNMREAFKTSCLPYYQELARRIGKERFQFYLDTTRYGNKNCGGKIDEFWLTDSLKITADEQVGFLKKLYFDELPFAERTQRIVRSLMLREDKPEYKLYYKTGTGVMADSTIYWIVGYAEKIEHIKEHANSMNKSDVRNYPFFFAQNFVLPNSDTSKNWFDERLKIMHEMLQNIQAISK